VQERQLLPLLPHDRPVNAEWAGTRRRLGHYSTIAT
jgi:hypothetical protein